ncbi:MAG: transposase [Deltaproteobacteria bacterium]|nr:transposase [Deltaproteobacteria bacterium]
MAWAEQAGITIRHIEPGQPNRNVYVERFNHTCREEFLSLYMLTRCAKARMTGGSVTTSDALMARLETLRRMNIVN